MVPNETLRYLKYHLNPQYYVDPAQKLIYNHLENDNVVEAHIQNKIYHNHVWGNLIYNSKHPSGSGACGLFPFQMTRSFVMSEDVMSEET